MSTGLLEARVVRFALPSGTGRTAPGGGSSRKLRPGAVLELRDAEGRSGWGEASPLPGYSDESPAAAAAVLLAWAAKPRTADTIAAVRGSAWRPPDGRELDSSPAARAAVVSALLDLEGRRSGRAVRELLAELLGGRNGTPNPGATTGRGTWMPHEVPLNALVGLADPAEAVAAASEAAGRGIRTIKAKLGPEDRIDADLRVLRALRTAFGSDLAIRLDANGQWSSGVARRILDRLREIEPEYVEEPVSGAALLELGDCPVPIAADESLRDLELADALLGSDAISVLVLKPSPLGGLDRCLDLADRAATGGKRCVVTHSFEGPVGHAAACELALALAGLDGSASVDAQPAACGLDRHAALEAWREVPVPQLGASRVVASPVTGLGVEPTPLVPAPGGRDGP